MTALFSDLARNVARLKPDMPPRSRCAAFIGLLVVGQMLASVTIDHFGWMGLAERAVDFTRLAGALS